MNNEQSNILKEQVLPISLTVVVCGVLIGLLYLEILFLNQFTPSDILLSFRFVDILVGLTVYLKTSIDFAIFIGHLMHDNSSWRSRISIEVGTAFGNAAGTFGVLALWCFFKEVKWLLALMIFLAALVLFKLAEQSLEHAKDEDDRFPLWFRRIVFYLERWLSRFNRLVAPALRYVVPEMSMTSSKRSGFWSLFALSFTIPFILGLDDFAGYVPLFSIVNVFGFAIGVLVGHMLLNMLLYISPSRTIAVVKNPVISLVGSFAFIGLGIWGLSEVAHMIG